MRQRNRTITVFAALLAMMVAGGCAKTANVEATGKGAIRGINSIVTAPDLNFKIEERSIGAATYKGAAGFAQYDDLSYSFNFDVLLPGDATATRLATQFIDVVADTQYTLVLIGTVANPEILSWEAPARAWDGDETVFEADFVHLSPVLGEVDVYFAPVGTAPVLGNAVGTLNFGGRISYAEYPDAQYQLIITPKDDIDPLNYLYQSTTLSSTPATRVTFAFFDPDPTITAGIAVSLINSGGGSASIPDVSKPANVRLLHAALGTDRVDGFLDNDFNSVVFQDVGFGELSTYTDFGSLATNVTLTDVGNTGAVVHEEAINGGGNSRITLILAGAPGTLLFHSLQDAARPLETFAVIRLANLSVNADFVDIYLLDPGTPISADVAPRYRALAGLQDTGFFGVASGSYEISITRAGELTSISAPIAIDVVSGNYADIVILDNVDPDRADLFMFNSNLP
jgi:hypothetical protein